MIARLVFVFALMCSASAFGQAGRWVVLDARGVGLKPGQAVDPTAQIQLKEGERVTLISPDGKTVSLRGIYSGTLGASAGSARSSREALAALLTTRDARVSAIGVVRAGVDGARLPDPWLIDPLRGGARCLREGTRPVFWRAKPAREMHFSLAPADRTWSVEMAWPAGRSTLRLPPDAALAGQSLLQVNVDGQEFPLALHVVPSTVNDPLVLSAWLLEKGCLQQADALLRELAPTARP